MRLQGEVDLHVSGQRVLRQPTRWERFRKRLGGAPDLDTERMHAALEATAVVDATRAALLRLGATDAVSLVIDDQVLFEDRDGRTDDLGDLFLAFSDHEPVFGGGFRQLRLAASHREGGLHLVLEVIARSEYAEHEPAARVAIAGRIAAFEPRPGEEADAYRARVEPLVRDASLVELARHQFESFVARVAEAMGASMPEARVELRRVEAQIERPPVDRPREPAADPKDPRYDPYEAYYPHPFDAVLASLTWAALLSWAHPPDVTVVDDRGDALGSGYDVAGHHGHEQRAHDHDVHDHGPHDHGVHDHGFHDHGVHDHGGHERLDGSDFADFSDAGNNVL